MTSRYYFLVGLFAGAGLLLVGSLFVGFGQMDIFVRGAYKVRCHFPEARGIQPGSPVLLVGIEVGKVSNVDFAVDPETGKPEAVLVLTISDERPIYEDTIAYIRREGIIPAPYVNLVPGPGRAIRLPMDGTAVIREGRLAPSLEDVIARVDTLSINLNKMLGDEEFRTSIKQAVADIRTAASEGAELAKTVQKLAVGMEVEVRAQSDSLQKLTAGISQTTTEVNQLFHTINSIVRSVEAGHGTLGELVKRRKLMGEILKTIDTTRQMLREMHELSRFIRRNPEALFWGRKDGARAAAPATKLKDTWWED